jgi:hypothetical protein
MCMQLLSYNFPQILGSVRQEPDIFPFMKRNSFLLIGHRAPHPHEPEKLFKDEFYLCVYQIATLPFTAEGRNVIILKISTNFLQT